MLEIIDLYIFVLRVWYICIYIYIPRRHTDSGTDNTLGQ